MKTFFNQLFDYNFYCNKKLIDQCVGIGDVPDRSRLLLSHILNAHNIWNSRILGKQPDYKVFEEHPITSWEDIHYENQRSSFEIIVNAKDFEQRIHYENSSQQAFSNTLGEMLFHIINHSTHHRGQIVADFRNQGLEPPVLDYIFYKR
ncbi:damage-inducible protein DinB [Flavobacteriaceae bacterium F89]|uniref:Damage-inducible protein DinB n=1 Tax=Cerina litoralis TaxID=2874477 RepID=A0AAE3ES62_9FLAO|nr:DinB family protein [Cerina litoralis]MCG2459144.1 damage-inducible protein DinB [Cerina litoralis]